MRRGSGNGQGDLFGQPFVEEQTTAPLAIWHYNDQCHGFVDRETTIRHALGNKFNLDELLRSAWEPSH